MLMCLLCNGLFLLTNMFKKHKPFLPLAITRKPVYVQYCDCGYQAANVLNCSDGSDFFISISYRGV